MALLILILVSAVVVAVVVGVVRAWLYVRREARRQALRSGYESVGDYLRATPGSDEERRDAVDMALKGLVICFVGLVFPPLILLGAFPLFYGARKIAYSSMGLGLVDDENQPSP